MDKAMTLFLYVSAIVVGWGMLRYFYGRRFAAGYLRAEQSAIRDRKTYQRAIGRWENEGGAKLRGNSSYIPQMRERR